MQDGFRRRDFLAAATASIAIAAISQAPKAESRSVRVRKRIDDPSIDPAEIALFRDAVGRLKSKDVGRPAADGWEAIAAPHIEHCFTNNSQEVHFSWWFLPWHRAYLHSMEKRLQAIVSEPKLRLFYWDWFQTNIVPTQFAGSADNPLFDATRAKTKLDRPPGYQYDKLGIELLGYLNEQELVAPPVFSNFGGAAVVPGVNRRPGSLELGPHNAIHVWVGGNSGNMGQAYSPRDPIFLAHHANIDRLWSVWKNNTKGLKPGEKREDPKDTAWLNQTFPMPHPSGVGFETYRIADMLNTDQLEYRYDRETMPGQFLSAEATMSEVFNLHITSAPLVFGDAAKKTDTLKLQADQINRIRDFAFDPAQDGRLVFQGVEVPPGSTKVEVFFNGGSTSTANDANFVGTFSLLDPSNSLRDKKLDFVLPVPDRIRRLIVNQPNLSFSVRAAGSNRPVTVDAMHLEIQ